MLTADLMTLAATFAFLRLLRLRILGFLEKDIKEFIGMMMAVMLLTIIKLPLS